MLRSEKENSLVWAEEVSKKGENNFDFKCVKIVLPGFLMQRCMIGKWKFRVEPSKKTSKP
jgi:hypothetical protein